MTGPGVMTSVVVLAAMMTSCHIVSGQFVNMLRNPGFEEDITDIWTGISVRMKQNATEKTEGNYSLHVSNRKRDTAGPSQILPTLKPGRGYEFRADIKLLNGKPNKLFQVFKAIVEFQFGSDGGNRVARDSSEVDPTIKHSSSLDVAGRNRIARDDEYMLPNGKFVSREEFDEFRWKYGDEAWDHSRRRRQDDDPDGQDDDPDGQDDDPDGQDDDPDGQDDDLDEVSLEDVAGRNRIARDDGYMLPNGKFGSRKEFEEFLRKHGDEAWDHSRRRRQDDDPDGQDDDPDDVSPEDVAVRSRAAPAVANSYHPFGKRSSQDEYHEHHDVGQNGNSRGKRPLMYSRRRRQEDDMTAEESQEDDEYSLPPGEGMNNRAARSASRVGRGDPSIQELDRYHEVTGYRTMPEYIHPMLPRRRRQASTTTVGKYIIAWRAWVTPESGWITLVGSINAPMLPFTRSTLHIRGPDPGCEFLIDNATFYEIPERKNWLTEARVSIDKHRKSNVTIRVNVPSTVPKSEIDIQVRLKKHRFAFGSKVEYKTMTERKYRKYRDIFFNLFNWATIGSFKWRFDEGTDLYEPDFSKAMEMLRVIEKHGFPVRAHSILWGVVDNVPDAVIATPVKDLPKLISHHTQYMMNLTKGRVAHWDVQNEILHGLWYEETLQDPNVSVNVFKEARPLDLKPKLYLNDFTAVTSGASTEDYHDTALRFIKEGTGIQGLGIQGHTKRLVKPDPTMMWRRLDRLAETGLELFMTEFDLGWTDQQVRADWFEDAIRAFYAHPGLSGVVLWGFWREIMRYDNKYLVYGEDFKFAEAGKRFYCLIKKEWRTNVKFNMASVSGDVTLRGFQGDYEIIVRRKGVPVQVRSFSLGKSTKRVKFNVRKRTKSIKFTQETDFVPQCISHRDRKSLGEVTATSSASNMTCTDVQAVQSATTSGSRLTVTCPQGSVMIGCSSYNKDRSSKLWRGEEITVENGAASCSAIIADNAQGLKVSARCCRQSGLKCDYRRAGPSSAMEDAFAEAQCPSGYTAIGCSVSSKYSHISAALPNTNLTSCMAKNGLPLSDAPNKQEGSVSMAACCTATQALKCRTVMSEASTSGANNVTVKCPTGDVMTACQAQASNGGTAGSFLTTNTNGVSKCKAYTAKDHPQTNSTVIATAVCCGS